MLNAVRSPAARASWPLPWRALGWRLGVALAAVLLTVLGGPWMGRLAGPRVIATPDDVTRVTRDVLDRLDALARLAATADAGALDRALLETRRLLPGAVDAGAIGVARLRADGQAEVWAGRTTPWTPGSIPSPDWQVRRVPGGLTFARRVPLAGADPAGSSAPPMLAVAEWWLPFTTGTLDAMPGRVRVGAVDVDTDRREGEGGTALHLTAPDGTRLLDGVVSSEGVARGARRAARVSRSVALALAALGLLSCLAPLWRWSRGQTVSGSWTALAVLVVPVLGASALLRAGSPAAWWTHEAFTGVRYASAAVPLLSAPAHVALAGASLLGLAATVAMWAAGGRAGGSGAWRWRAPLAGAVAAALGSAVSALVRDTVASSALDLRTTALLDWHVSRVLLQCGLLLTAGAATLLSVTVLAGRRPWHRPGWQSAGAWVCGAGAVLLATRAGSAGVWLTLASLAGGWLMPRLAAGHGRPGRRAAALGLLLVAVSTGVALEVQDASTRSERDLVETRLVAEVLGQREGVKARLQSSMDAVDGLDGLAALVESGATTAPSSERAFTVWQATPLSQPVSSSVELVTPDGRLVSRFAFNLPAAPDQARSVEDRCAWSVSEEVSPFFGEDRRIWRAARALCGPEGELRGGIVLHATVDRSDLPFLSTVGPYQALSRRGVARLDHALLGSDVEYAVYGWSGRALSTSRGTGWALSAEALEAAGQTRRPMWVRLTRGADAYTVLIFGDRGGIHALGLPVPSRLARLTDLAEASVLGAVLALLAWLTRPLWTGATPAGTRRLWSAQPTRYYRRLLAAFVAVAVIPVVGLAVLFRESAASRIRATTEQDAARTVAAAQRAVVDLAPVLNGGIDDDLLTWVGRLIGEDVNVYRGSELTATSGRALFAAGLLSPRTPAALYRDVVLGLRADAVREDALDDLPVLLAGAPLGTGQPPLMVVVPLALRQQGIEAEIALLDRRVLLVALLFVVVGGAVGYSLAERMADPVRRLARAARRIRRGDLDVTVLVRSADEFRALAEEFNAMAVELGRQRRELERTHRLEAWSEVARQVAHDIKNPLTPIQLNAEHVRRVHADQGRPLGPVVDACVEHILTQVRLLRAIASEFSNFASSPRVEAEPVPARVLMDDLLTPFVGTLPEGVRLDAAVDPDLGVVSVDRVLAGRALANLFENALQALGGRGVLRVSAGHAGDRDGRAGVAIRIGDDGPGMEPAALARAFEPYFSTKAGGTGLGLPIAKRNVEACGGTVAMESEPGRGTTVTVWWPLATAAQPD